MINSLLKLNKHFNYKFIAKFFHQFSFRQLFQRTALSLFNLAFKVGVARTISAFKSVNQRALSTVMTTLVLSAFLTACGGGGGGGGSDAPAPTAPTFSVSSSNISIDEDFATSQLVASVSNATSITVSQSNTGVVTVTTSNSQVDVSSIANANGRTTLTISAANGTLIATTQVTVIVNAVNDTPTLAVSSNNISTVGGFSPITINTTASDVEDANLTFTVAESTTGVVTVVTSTNAITLSEIPGGSGQTTLTITAVDSSGSTVTQTIAVNVFNRAPVLTAFTTLVSLQEDFTTLVTFIITASDLDGDVITLSVSSTTRLVDAAISTLTNGVSGITLSAIANANGTTTLTVQATAAGQSVSTNVVVVVAPVNDPPTIAVSSNSISTVGGFSPITINTTASDIEDGTLPFTVSDSNPGVVAVTTSANGITLNAISGVSSQTILTVRTADRAGTTVTRTISVNVINTTPELMVSTNLISVQEDFSASVMFGITATDLDGDTLTLSLSSTTRLVDAAISTLTRSTITLSAIANANGTTTLTIQAMDVIGQSVSRDVVVVVTPVNDTPTLTIPNANLVVAEDFSGHSTIATALDIDGDPLTFSVSESTTGLVTVSTSASGVTISNRPHANGVTTLTITIGDGLLSSTAQVVVTVTAVNDPPVLTIPTATLTAMEDFAGGITVATASDVDGNSLTFSVIESTTGVIRVTVSTSDVGLSSLGNANGITTLSISVSDGRTASSTAQVVVTVTAVNDPPVLSVSTAALTLAEDFTTVLIATTRTDIDSNTLTLTVTESTAGVVNATITDAGIQVANIANANGRTTLAITLSDGVLSTTTQVVVTVTPVNDPPVLTVSTTALTLAEDFATTEVITVARSDIDGDTLTLTVTESATGVVSLSTSSAGVQVVSIADANGQTTLTITVGDGTASASTQVLVTVNAINDPPVLSVSTNALTLSEDFATTEVITVTRSDVDGDTLTLTVAESATGVVSVSTSSTGIQLVSITDANGQTTLTITLSDGRLSTTTQVVVDVTAVNDPPVLSVSPDTLTLNEDFATTEVLTVTSSDVDSNTLTLTVSESSTGVVTVTTSASGVQLVSILNANGRTTLTIRVTDGDGLFASTDILVVVNNVDDPPALTISTNLILVDEDFSSPVVIRTTVTDADGDALIVSISSSSHLFDAVLSTPVNGMSIITNMITLTAMTDLNGTTTLTVQAIDAGGTATTEQIVVVVNAVDDPIPFTLSTTAVSLSVPGSQLDRIINAISISNPENKTLRAQIGVTASGDNIFSTNPAPVVSFTTNALTAVTTLTSTTPTAQLYFTIAPNQTGTATLTVHLTNLDDSSTSQQTMVVSVNSSNVPPAIVAANSSITNLVVHGGHLYANDAMASGIGISRFLTTARTLGGHLMNINSVEEFSFMRSAASGLIIGEAWLGMVLPQQRFPGELSWITHDSTIGYGYARTNGAANLTVYPGHFNLTWFPTSDLGLRANRYGRSTTVANWTIFATGNGGVFFLIDDGGDGLLGNGNFRSERNVIYEFPQGLLTTSTNPTSIVVVTSATVRLTGFDLNGDTISTNDWSITDPNGGSAIFNNDSQSSGVQTVTMIYTAPANFVGQTTVVVTLQVDGLSTTHAISFIVDEPPTIALSTRHITLAEDFGTFDIGTTVTDRLMSTSLPFSVSASPSGILTITTSANNIQLSAISNAHGTATLTVQAMDARGQSSIANVVVVVAPVNDPPVLAVSTTALTLNEDFGTVLIAATRSDVDGDNLTLTVSESTTGVVTITTTVAGVQVANIANANGQTTLIITLSDGRLRTTAQVVVDVIAVNDPPVLSVSTATLTLAEDFGTVLIAATRSDVDGDNLTLTVSESTTGVITVTTTVAGVQVANITNANGQTTLTITLSDGRLSTTAQVVVDVIAVNDPPVLSVSTTALTLLEDFATTEAISVTRSDIDSSTLTLTVSESTTGVVTVTTSASGVQVVSILNANGRTTLTVRVTDGDGLFASTDVIVVVNEINDPPVLSVSTATLILAEDFATTEVITVTRSDIDGDTLTLIVSESTTGVVTVTTSVSGISVLSILNVNGQTTLTITLSDGRLSTTTQVVVNVIAVNDPPVLIVSTTALTLTEDFATTEVITVTRSDVDGDTLALTVAESTTGVVSVSTSSTGVQVVSITDANGQTTLTITVGDGTASVSTQVLVTVNAINDPPVLSVSTTALTVLEDFATTEVITVTSSDVDGDTLALTVSESTTGVISVSTSSVGVQVVSITDANGQTTLTITVGDGTANVSIQVLVVVNAVNDPPVLSVSPDTLTLNEDFATTEVITVIRSDVDGDTLTFTVSESATGVVSVSTSSTGIQVVSIADVNGQTTLTITVGDGTVSVSTQVLVTVNAVNDPPVLSASPDTLTLNEDFATTEVITVTRSDIDSSTLTLTVTESATGLVNVSTSSTGVQVVSIADANGQTTLTITVSDGTASASTQVLVTVNAVNDTPTLTISSNSISTVGGFSPITINTTASDIEDANISFTVLDANTGVVRVTTSTNAIVLNTISGASGQTTLTATVVDSSGAMVTEIITVSVSIRPSVATPVVTISTNLISVQEDFRTPVIIQTTVTDADGDTITVSVSASMPFVNAVISTPVNRQSTISNSITLTAIADVNGTATLTVLATDSGGQSNTTEIVVVVSSVEDTPTLTIPSTTLTVAEDFASTLTIATANDVDGDTLLISVVESTTGIVTVTTSALEVSVSSILNANGQTTLTIAVRDGFLTSTAQVVVTVTPVNDPPALTIPTTTLTVMEDFAGGITVATAIDVDGDTLTLTVSESTTGVVTVTTSASGVQVVSILNANGQTTLTITLSDGRASVSTQVLVIVNAVNDPPVLSVSSDTLTLNEDFAATEVITVTRSDVDGDTVTLTVFESTTDVVTVTTSVSGVQVASILNANGRTTLTVRVTDGDGLFNTTDILVVVNDVDDPPALTVSTNFILVDEDFSSPVVIRTTATDADGDALIVSISSSSRLVDAVLSTPVNGMSIITNMITLTALTDLNGTTTLTVQAIDAGGTATTEQIVVVVNAIADGIPFTLSTSAVSLSVPGSQLDRIVKAISISNPENKTLRAQIGVAASGDNIFSANPAPVVSFTTNALTTTATLTSAASTAQLYFTIAPNSTGTATLVVQLTNLDTSSMTQQTMVVQVNSVNVPPTIIPTISSITRLTVYGGRLYANASVLLTVPSILEQARSLGGHLININSVEEFDFVRISDSDTNFNIIRAQNAWFGLALPQPTFPGELSWITNNSTIAYGFVSTTTRTTGNLTVYPGHFPLPWDPGAGLIANRSGTNAFNWTVYSRRDAVFFLLGDSGDANGDRRGLYEFPQGLTPTSINPISFSARTNASLNLMGFDLNGDTINTNDWSITDPNGGSAIFGSISQTSGVQTVNMIYTAPANFNGQTTVTVTLQVNGLSTTSAISFIVDGPPTIALSTNAITLAEEFSNFVIGTTVTDQGASGSLPFSVQTASTGLVNLSTTINSIQFSGALNFNGRATLTVQATGADTQTGSALVVVTVEGVNDTPTISVSTNNISTMGGFSPITIDTTATDIEQGALPFTVQASPQGVVSISTNSNAIVLSPIVGASGRTTLTVSTIDSDNAIDVQTIAVNVVVSQSTIPVLRVSTNLIGLQEDFATIIIGTTATDVESGTLVVTVSSSTHLVNTVISTHSITLSSVANLFGTTTLTVRARDDGGLFDSTEIVVIVASVNDTPTLTVSSSTVILGSAPVVLNVTAFDVEDTTLSFSVSSGQGYVNVVITTTRLTISRIGLNVSQVILSLRTTDSDSALVSTSVTVVLPPLFVISTGIKTLDFAWSADSSATYYRLRSEPVFGSGYVDLSTRGIVVSPNSTNIRQTTAQGLVSLHRYIPSVTNPLYGVDTCDATSCGTSFRHNTVALTNVQLNSMIGRLQASNPDTGDLFGWSVDLSGDGNTLAVGAYFEDGSSTGLNGAHNNDSVNSGAVYLFRRMGGAWSQQAYIKASNPNSEDRFGWSVSLNDDGNTLVVGAPSEDGSSTGVNRAQIGGISNAGAVYVFRFSGSVWSQQAYIKASNTGDGDRFGYAVALSGDGNTLAVGARNEGSSSTGVNRTQNNDANLSGATYLFRIDSGMWSQQAFIKASNSTGGIQFGYSVSLNKDGNTLAVGATNENNSSSGINGDQNNHSFAFSAAGAVYLFRFNPTSSIWSQQAYIKASISALSGQFGHSVDLSDDGNTLAVGEIGERSNSTGVNGMQNTGAANSGAAYVFRFSAGASTWSQQAFIKASNTGTGNRFGVSVSISGDGNALVVGSQLEDGSAIGVEGNNDASTTILNSGAAYVFEFGNGTWAQQAFIKATDTSGNANFGRSVSISNDGGAIAVGAWGTADMGAVYLY